MAENYHLNVFLTPGQSESLQTLKTQTGLNVSEITRRMFDYCLREDRLNELVPSMSGQLLKDK